MLYDILVHPVKNTVVSAVSITKWERKWAEIIAVHLSPHDVWTVHDNWKFLRDGTYSFPHPVKGETIITVRNGKRLIRNHRQYWKNYLVPHFFTDEQWDYLCKYHKEKYRQLFIRGRTFPVNKKYHEIPAEPDIIIDGERNSLYRKFRRDLKDVIGKDRYGKTYRMDAWNWGKGECSLFVPIRTEGEIKEKDIFPLDFMSETTLLAARDPKTIVYPKYHKIETGVYYGSV